MPPWNELVIYEMHVGTFNDQPGGAPGNLDKAIEKLGYLQELDVNAVQLMPPMEFAGGFSWGYNPAHIFAIEGDYGGPDALKTHGRFRLVPGNKRDMWAHPVIHQGRLYVRYHDTLWCFDIRAK